MEKYQAHLLWFGLGGHVIDFTSSSDYVQPDGTVAGPNKCTLSGYDSPESFERSLKEGKKSTVGSLAGVPVLDKRAILREKPSLAIRAPLLDVSVKDGEIDRFDAKTARNMLPFMDSGFRGMAALGIVGAKGDGPGPLDSVSVRDYIAWWSKNGARTGRMSDDGLSIVWAS